MTSEADLGHIVSEARAAAARYLDALQRAHDRAAAVTPSAEHLEARAAIDAQRVEIDRTLSLLEHLAESGDRRALALGGTFAAMLDDGVAALERGGREILAAVTSVSFQPIGQA
jgi:hypothetical protein